MGLFSKGRGVVGLDIGSSSVKLVELKPGRKKGYQLVSLGMATVPPDSIVDGALMNATTVGDAIRGIISAAKLRTKECAISVAGHSVIVKKINLPTMTSEELEESIQWEAEQYIPFDINDVNVDFQILGSAAEEGQMSVLLVAAKKDMINDYITMVRETGLNPVVVDIDAFAIENMFEVNYPITQGEVVALVNMGASVININVLKGGVTAFTRDVSAGGHQYTEEIQKAMNVNYDEAEKMKIGAKEAIPPELSGIFSSVSENIASEIQRSLDFFSATAGEDKIVKIFLSGGCAKTPGLDGAISQKANTPVEIVNSFNNIEFSPRTFEPEYIADISPASAVAVGLALRMPGDK